MSDGEGLSGGGEMKAGVGGRCQSTKIHQCHPMLQRRDFFRSQEFFLLMTIADSPLLSPSASGLNFYDYSGCSSLLD
jgi:hypothetical protein